MTGLLTLAVLMLACSWTAQSAPSGPPPTPPPPNTAADFELWAEGKIPAVSIDAGKEQLANYHEVFSMQFNGQDTQGQSIQAGLDYQVAVDRVNHRQSEKETTVHPDKYWTGSQETMSDGKQFYRISPAYPSGIQCSVEPAPSPELGTVINHTQMIVTITPGKRLAENVMVSGLAADVYEIKSVRLSMGKDPDQISGKVWIARDKKFFVKAEGQLNASLDYENKSYRGPAHWQYEVKDLNQTQVEVPTLCALDPAKKVPLPQDAREVTNGSNRLNYSSAVQAADLRAFYLQELPSQGWTLAGQKDENPPYYLQATRREAGLTFLLEISINAMSEGSYVTATWVVAPD